MKHANKKLKQTLRVFKLLLEHVNDAPQHLKDDAHDYFSDGISGTMVSFFQSIKHIPENKEIIDHIDKFIKNK